VFLVLKIVDESDPLTCIHLSASSEGRELIDTYLEIQRAEMPEFSLVMMFGRLLCFMGEHGKAREHFENLLESSAEDKPSLHHNLAFIHDKQQNFTEALRCYDQACILLREADPPRRQELAATLNNMAAVFSQVRQLKLVATRRVLRRRLSPVLRLSYRSDLFTAHVSIPEMRDCRFDA
jgi:tetratricopeptide (TPR) repeat protein